MAPYKLLKILINYLPKQHPFFSKLLSIAPNRKFKVCEIKSCQEITHLFTAIKFDKTNIQNGIKFSKLEQAQPHFKELSKACFHLIINLHPFNQNYITIPNIQNTKGSTINLHRSTEVGVRFKPIHSTGPSGESVQVQYIVIRILHQQLAIIILYSTVRLTTECTRT